MTFKDKMVIPSHLILILVDKFFYSYGQEVV